MQPNIETNAVMQLQAEIFRLNSRIATIEQQELVRYRAIVEEQTELICRFSADGSLTYVNEAYCRYFNRSYDELIGHSFLLLIPDEDTPILEAAMASLSPRNPIITVTHRVILDSGELRWQSWVDRFIYNKAGTFVEAQAVGRDVTEEMQLVEKLVATHRDLQQIVGARTASKIDVKRDEQTSENYEPDGLAGAIKRLIDGNLIVNVDSSRRDMPKRGAAKYSADSMMQPLGSDSKSESVESLTRRELEILKLVAQGKINSQIAHLLSIRDVTVRTHVSNIMKKLEVENRVQAALYAIRAELVQLP